MALLQPPIKFDHHARDWTDRKGLPIRKIVLHATVSADNNGSLTWLEGNPEGTSIHVLIRKSGLSYKMLDESKGANHVGFSKIVIDGVTYSQFSPHNVNQISVGIELVNWNNGKDPYPEAQLRSCAWWVDAWMKEFKLQRSDVICHRDIDAKNNKTDPRGITTLDIFKFLDAPPVVDPDAPRLTAMTPILGPTMGNPEQAAAFLTKHGSDPSYTPNDHKIIAHAYWSEAALVGINPVMVFAQMLHETGYLTSWWSMRPRRNPAGIGVTGETSRTKIKPGGDWQMDDRSKLWKKGCAFANWQDAVDAHLGHLILYAVVPSERTDAQKKMVTRDPRAPIFPIQYRGIAPTWIELNGRYAVPGTTYAQKIFEIANAILAS
jgi:hypothetical protein